jgi:hypothetical protein
MSAPTNRIARSFRGEMVDFDLLEAKSNLLKAPVPDASQQREVFIDSKRRRRPRRRTNELLADQQSNEAAVRAAIQEQKQRERKAAQESPEVEDEAAKPASRKIVKETVND